MWPRQAEDGVRGCYGRLDGSGEGGEEGEDKVRREWGILDIFTDRAHISGQLNGENWMEDGRNGVGDKKISISGTCDRVNFLVAYR